ncbi:MAG: carboxypeptidase-like regulatory domain-containing protein [Acidobacteria bacterium]|nr:carboxypeptidase-like regulatory domain-containing protein [Acidobacteriota bacterium]
MSKLSKSSLFLGSSGKGSRWNALLAAVLVLCLARPAQSQTTFASITGTVTDPSGATVPNVKIVVKNLATNIETSATSNEVGNYTVPQLKEGTYSLRAAASGFSEFIVQEVVLAARDIRRIDMVLKLGAEKVVVEVKGGATLIETETARIADTKDAETLKSLPLNTRSIYASLALSPNVLQAAGSSTIRFAGSQTNQSNWAMDGITMADGVSGTQIGTLADYLDWVQEFKIDIANNTADVGPIGQVTIVSKSGTSKLHGSVFDYYSTPWFRARNPFASARPIGVRHSPGFAIGGPVYLPKLYNGVDKTFFFASFETARGSDVFQFLQGTVPAVDWRQGNFSGLPGGVQIFDPLSGQPFPGNRIPDNRINPVARKLQDRFYPLPNFGDPNVFGPLNYRQLVSRPLDYANYLTIRGDHRISDRSSIFGRYSWREVDYPYLWGAFPTLGQWSFGRFNSGASVSFTHVFRPTLISESRWGYAFNNIPISGPINGPAFAKEFGLVGLAPDLPDISGMLNVGWLGIGLTGLSQVNFSNPGFRNHLQDFQQYLTWYRTRHSFKMGFNVTRVELDSFAADASLFGAVSFSNRFSSGGLPGQGHPYADFLLGIPTTASRAPAPIRQDSNRWQYDFFFMDDFKVSPKLTLNLGVRYELHLPWRENQDRIAMFDIGSGNIVVPDGALSRVSPLFPKGYVGIVEAKSAGLPGRSLLRPDKNNIAPRIGIAYRPWGNSTVFRAGYGIFYNVVPWLLPMASTPPFALRELPYTNPVGNPDVILPRVFPDAGTAGPSTVGLPTAVNPNLRMPYSMQYNFTIERQQWDTGFRVSYIGTNTRKGEWSYDYNSPVPDARPYVEKPRPFPQYPGITYLTNGAGHQYNALTVEAERRMAAGLYFQSSWSWARDIFDLEPGGRAENPFDRLRERAVSPDIPTHRFTTNALYQLPFGKGRPWLAQVSRPLDWAVGGWEISAVYSVFSGSFLTPFWSGPDPTGTAFTTSRTPAFVSIRPDQLRDPNLAESQRSVNRWFDASAFAAPQPGRFGTAAKGVIKGPGVNVWHMGLFKTLLFQEQQGLRLRLELTATNMFNHPNWSNPATNISQAGNVGVISNVGGVSGASTGDQPGARAFRAGIRLEW